MQQLSVQTEEETLGYLLILSSDTELSLLPLRASSALLPECPTTRSRSHSREPEQQRPGLLRFAPAAAAAACEEKLPESGRLSWHELTSESDMETKPFLSLGELTLLCFKRDVLLFCFSNNLSLRCLTKRVCRAATFLTARGASCQTRKLCLKHTGGKKTNLKKIIICFLFFFS